MGDKFTIDAPSWVSKEERAWALDVAQLIYEGTQLKYVDKSNLKKAVVEGNRHHLDYNHSDNYKTIADSIEIIKVTWDWRTSGSRGVTGDIIFQIVVGILGLEKFTVYIGYSAMNKRRLNRDWIIKGYENRVLVYVDKVSGMPIAYVDLGPLADGEVGPATMARACIAGIQSGVHFQKCLLMMDVETLNVIHAAILPSERESEYPRVEMSPNRRPEKLLQS